MHEVPKYEISRTFCETEVATSTVPCIKQRSQTLKQKLVRMMIQHSPKITLIDVFLGSFILASLAISNIYTG